MARTDPARRAAFDVLRAVADSDAYANLVLPPLLAQRHLSRRDAAFATELAYGTLRLRGYYDAVITQSSSRPLAQIDPRVLDALRLGAHQVLRMRVPTHAAVAETVDLVRATANPGAAGFANAIMRSIARDDAAEWDRRLTEQATSPTEALAIRTAHPEWIVRAMRESLALDLAEQHRSGDLSAEVEALLAADNLAPAVTLVARPGLVSQPERDHKNLRPFPGVPTALTLTGGSPEAIPAIRQGRMGVQDAGSQLVALALAAVGIDGRDEQWADVCAGPGGKTALLGAELAQRSAASASQAHDGEAHLIAGEVQSHRVGLVRRSVKALPKNLVEVVEWDGREVGTDRPGAFDRVLVDAPCTGLGALRRRPEARWRRTPSDIPPLTHLQRELLDSAIAATRPGGVVGYVTCSPHLAETRSIVDQAVRRHAVDLIDAAAAVRTIAPELPGVGPGPTVQLWPHRQGTDAMFLAILQVR